MNPQLLFPAGHVLDLPAGLVLEGVAAGALWRVVRGVAGLNHPVDDGDQGPQAVALPGDLLGVEGLARPCASRVLVQALTDLRLSAVGEGSMPQDRAQLLAEAYDQARRQSRELLRLRTGPVPERVRHLLMLLGMDADVPGAVGVALPSLRRLADIVGSSPETVCRILGKLRAMRLIEPAALRRTRVATEALRVLVPPAGMTSSAVGRLVCP